MLTALVYMLISDITTTSVVRSETLNQNISINQSAQVNHGYSGKRLSAFSLLTRILRFRSSYIKYHKKFNAGVISCTHAPASDLEKYKCYIINSLMLVFSPGIFPSLSFLCYTTLSFFRP